MTESLEYAIGETNRRREKQIAYNKENNIVPQGIKKGVSSAIGDILSKGQEKRKQEVIELNTRWGKILLKDYIPMIRRKMKKSAEEFDFENALVLRNEANKLEKYDLSLPLSAVNVDIKLVEKLIK